MNGGLRVLRNQSTVLANGPCRGSTREQLPQLLISPQDTLISIHTLSWPQTVEGLKPSQLLLQAFEFTYYQFLSPFDTLVLVYIRYIIGNIIRGIGKQAKSGHFFWLGLCNKSKGLAVSPRETCISSSTCAFSHECTQDIQGQNGWLHR